MKTEVVSLKITYDENYNSDPELWDWNDLCDMMSDENIEVTHCKHCIDGTCTSLEQGD